MRLEYYDKNPSLILLEYKYKHGVYNLKEICKMFEQGIIKDENEFYYITGLCYNGIKENLRNKQIQQERKRK